MSQDVKNHHRYTAKAATAPRLDSRLLALAVVLAAIALLAVARGAYAAASPQQVARQTAQGVLDRVSGRLSGALAGEPVLVHSMDRRPAYYIVPATKSGRTAGLVGVSADGGSWQWYTDSYGGARFPMVSETQARAKLGSGDVVLVSGDNKQLYWAGTGAARKVVSADSAGSVTTYAAVDTAAASEPDVRLGAAARREAADPQGGTTMATASALPVSRNLSVPHYYQINSYYCGPASMQMLFDLYNPAIKAQEDIADVMNAKDWGSWKGAYADDLMRTARFSYFSSAVQNSALKGFNERKLGYSAMSNFWSDGGSTDPDYATRYSDLKALIAGGNPVLMLTWYDGTHRIGHFRVLKGYDDNTNEFIVNDPWYTAPYYGPDVHFNQNFLVDNLWARYYRWAVVVAPWRVTVSAPASVTSGSSFTVSATVRYRGPHPLNARGAVTGSQAQLSAPSGFTVAQATKPLTKVTTSGTYQTVSWTVTPPAAYQGDASVWVTAKGKLNGSSTSYSSYTDWIGGRGNRHVTVGAAPSDNRPPTGAALSPTSLSSGPNEYRALKATYSDPNGASDLRTAMVLVNRNVEGTAALYVAYSTASNQLYLRRADNSGWLPGVAPGSRTVLDNGYARLDASRTTVTRSGTNLVVSWMVSERDPSSGNRFNVYLQTEDKAAALSAWRSLGTWIVNRPATAGRVAEVGSRVAPERTVAINATFSDPDGVADIQTAQLLINKQLAGAGAVWVRYDPVTNKLYLRNGTNTGWMSPITPGLATTRDNGKVLLVGRSSHVSRSGSSLSVRWSLRFHQAFSGNQYSLYSVAADAETSMSALPWINQGAYTVNRAPAPSAVSPRSGQSRPGTTAQLTATYGDADGAGQIRRVNLLVGSTLDQRNAALVSYNTRNNRLYLRNDAGSAWLGGIIPGSSNSVSNEAATLMGRGTTVSRSGRVLTVRWSLAFRPAYSGKRYNVYGYAEDGLGARSGWKTLGAWTVNRRPAAVSVIPKSSSSKVGGWVRFASVYSDADGAGNLASVLFIVNSQPGGSKGVMLRYDALKNRLWMRKADLTGWIGGVAPGTARRFSTRFGSLDTGKVTVSRQGGTLTVRWYVSLWSGMKGRGLHQYMSAQDLAGSRTGNKVMGTWTVK